VIPLTVELKQELTGLRLPRRLRWRRGLYQSSSVNAAIPQAARESS
jgi:hypothetical protein